MDGISQGASKAMRFKSIFYRRDAEKNSFKFVAPQAQQTLINSASRRLRLGGKTFIKRPV
jgi:hypothetical protein